MSIMVAEVYEALISAGAPEDKAKAAAAAIPIGENLATKQDIAELKAKDLAEIRADIAGLKVAMRYNTMFQMLIIGLLVKLVFFP